MDRRSVVCLGNEFVCDDGVGIRVGQVLAGLPLQSDVELVFAPALSVDLLEVVLGSRAVVVVDATTTGREPGSIWCAALDEVAEFAAVPYCCHAIGLPELLRLAGCLAPERTAPQVSFVGIEAAVIDRFGTELSERVRAALPGAVAAVLGLLSAPSELVERGRRAAETALSEVETMRVSGARA